MWRVLYRKTRTDFTSRPYQFLLTGLLLAFSAAGITLGVTVSDAADAPWERAFERANGPHIWMSADRAEDFDIPFGMPEVSETGPVMRSVSDFFAISTDEKPRVVVVEAPEETGQFVSKPLLTKGRWVDFAATAPEIVIGTGTAQTLDLKPGDEWTIGGVEREVTYHVVGVGVLPFRAPYPTWDPVFAFTNSAGFEGLLSSDTEVRYRTGMRLHEPELANVVQRRIRDLRLSDDPVEVGSISWQAVLEGVNEEILFYQITFFLFGTLAALASMMVVANAIAGQVIAQTREIGILKAVGLTPGGVLRVFILENVAVALIAGVVGVASGVGLVYLLIGRNANLFGGAYIGIPWTPLAVSLLITVLIAAIATLVPAFRAGRLPVAGVMPGRSSGGHGKSWRGPISRLLRGYPAYTAGAGMVWASRSRAILTIATIVVAVISSMLLLGFNNLLFDRDVQVRLGAPPGGILVNQVGDVQPGGLLPVIQDSRVESGYMYRPFAGEFKVDENTWVLNARAFDSTFVNADWNYFDGRSPDSPGEVMIGWGLANDSGVSVGDTALFGIDGQAMEVTVSGISTTGDNNGYVVWVSAEDFEQLTGEAPILTSVVVTLKSGASESEFISDFSSREDIAYNLASVQDEIDSEIGQFTLPVYTLSGMMLAVAALSVLTSTLLTVRERYRDIASLKATGMTPAQVVTGIVTAVTGLAAIGLAVGLPLGFVMNRQLMGIIGEESSAGPNLVADPKALGLVVMCAVIVAVVAVSALIPARAGAKISVSEALRSE